MKKYLRNYKLDENLFAFDGICRPAGGVDRGADCYTKGTGFKFRVRHAFVLNVVNSFLL